MIRAAVKEQLAHEPLVEARNRKPLARIPEFGARWRLRRGPSNRFRLLYGVDEAKREVQVLAIGVKERNRLIVGGEEFTL